MHRRMNPNGLLAISVVLLWLGIAITAGGKDICVDTSAAPGGNGNSWATAFKYLQDALTAAQAGDAILVAQGNYYPDRDSTNPGGTGDPALPFALVSNVRMYGGYPKGGGEKSNWLINKTILSGNIGEPAGAEDNSYHVVVAEAPGGGTLLDGFYIESGYADGAGSDDEKCGGGMFISGGAGVPVVSRCCFANNYAELDGGGLFVTSASPKLSGCRVTANLAGRNGGGLYADGGALILVRCRFGDIDEQVIGNAAGNNGGGLYCTGPSGSHQMTNCTFVRNSADNGGGIYNNDCTLNLMNCLITESGIGGYGGGIYCYAGCNVRMTNCTVAFNAEGSGCIDGSGIAAASPSVDTKNIINVENCIVWNYTCGVEQIWINEVDGVETSDVTVTYSDIQLVDGNKYFPLWPGVGNLNIAPGFWPGNCRLWEKSPCVDAADNTKVPADFRNLDNDDDLAERTPHDLYVKERGELYRFQNVQAAPDTGVSNPPRYPAIVDMGAYEYPGEMVPPPGGGGGADPCKIHVDTKVTLSGNGSSWSEAKKFLSNAVEEANDNTIIFVAAGNYKTDTNDAVPHGTRNRKSQFKLKKGVIIRGGYAGIGAADPNERNTRVHKTFLSGDLDGNDVGDNNDPSRNENSFHVVDGSDTDASAVLDGFIITGGNADGSGADGSGGGLYIDLGSPRIIDCTFAGNSADANGGAVYNDNGSEPTLTNCILRGNTSKTRGGAIFNIYFSSPTLANCTVVANDANKGGGGMFSTYGCVPTVTNTILWGNKGSGTSGQSGQIGGPNQPLINFSCVQGLTGSLGGLGNISNYPQFVDSNLADPNNDFRLQSAAGHWDPNQKIWVPDGYTSPCIDAGNPSWPLGDEPNDANNLRVNMGAYGGTSEASRTPQGWSFLADLTNDGTVDLDDLGFFVDDWLDWSTCGPGNIDRAWPLNMADYTLLGQDWLAQTSWYVP